MRPLVPTWSVMLVGAPYENAATFHKPHNPGERLPLHDPRVREYTARWVEADDAQVTLDVDGAKRTLLYAEVVRATVQVEFSRPGEDA